MLSREDIILIVSMNLLDLLCRCRVKCGSTLRRSGSLARRYDEAMALCRDLLPACPDSCALRDALAELHLQQGEEEKAVDLWLQALAECHNNAEVFYRCCRFLMARVRLSHTQAKQKQQNTFGFLYTL